MIMRARMTAAVLWTLAGLLAAAGIAGATNRPAVTAPLTDVPADTLSPAPAPAVSPAPAPVVFDADTLFTLYGRLGAFSPADRAAGVVARAARLARTVGPGGDSIRVVDAETHTDLMIGETVLMSVLDADAAALAKPRAEAAAGFARTLSDAMGRHARQTSLRGVLLSAGYTVLATVGLVLALWLTRLAYPRLRGRLERFRATRVPSLRIQQLEILSAERITQGLLKLLGLLRAVWLFFIFYLYVPLVLSFFPWTAPLAGNIIHYLLDPLRSMAFTIIGYLPSLFFVVVIAVVANYAIKLIHAFFRAVESGTVVLPGFYTDWAEPTFKIVRFLVIALVTVVAFPYLPGAKSDAFKGVSIFLGALISFGSSSAISNIVAGVLLTYTRAFQLGDRVQIGDTTGDVVEKTLLITRVRTIKNIDITVPNSTVLSSHIVNYTTTAASHGIILHTTVTIGYDAPWKQVHELLISAARATEHVLESPAPFVLQTSLDDFYVSYQLNAYTAKPEVMARTYSRLHELIQDRFNEAGVEILSPHYRAARDGNLMAVPASYLPPGYEAPAFRVSRVDGKE